MNKILFNKYRILFYRQGCPHCDKYLKFIEKINGKLPINKRIRLIDCTYWQSYGIITDPLIELFNRHIKGFPFFVIDGIAIGGINTQIETEAFLESYLNKEFLVYEYNNYMFNIPYEYQEDQRTTN